MTNKLQLSSIPSPIGALQSGFTEKGLALLSFAPREDLKIPKGLEDAEIEVVETQANAQLKQELAAYFQGNLTEFTIPLDLHGTEFQVNVWNALLKVPHGVTRSYKEQSILLGDVKAIRAVATANGANPIAIVVPCHRIIGSNQSLTGYAGGLERKQFLLELESNQGRLF
jgi:O-6-methylguanine DNA methyltransferase